MKHAFYHGAIWVAELEPKLMPLLAHYDAILVKDAIGLWEAWPDAA